MRIGFATDGHGFTQIRGPRLFPILICVQSVLICGEKSLIHFVRCPRTPQRGVPTYLRRNLKPIVSNSDRVTLDRSNPSYRSCS